LAKLWRYVRRISDPTVASFTFCVAFGAATSRNPKRQTLLERWIPEVLAKELRDYIPSTIGLLFATADGKPLQQRNVLWILHAVKGVGFHAFRRFRLTWLRKNGVPKDLERIWMGHASEEVGDLYSKLKEDVAFRQEWAERIGLGFELVHNGPQNAEATEAEKVA
jgi:integrase